MIAPYAHQMLSFEAPAAVTLHDARPDLPDDPASHRWRAAWMKGGILLTAHRVVRNTRCGVWISTDSYWRHGPDDDHMALRFLNNGSRQAWAKPTRKEALYSLVIRLDRWASRVARDRQRVLQACETAAALIPDVSPSLLNRAREAVK